MEGPFFLLYHGIPCLEFKHICVSNYPDDSIGKETTPIPRGSSFLLILTLFFVLCTPLRILKADGRWVVKWECWDCCSVWGNEDWRALQFQSELLWKSQRTAALFQTQVRGRPSWPLQTVLPLATLGSKSAQSWSQKTGICRNWRKLSRI